MGFYAEPYLREARDRIKSSSAQTGSTNTELGDFNQIADAVEKAIKAALVENSGSIPQKLESQNLVSICQTTGVWDVLPPALRGLVQDVATLRSTANRSPESLKTNNSSAQLKRYYQIAR